MNISKNIFALIITIFAFSLCAPGQTENAGDAAKSNQTYDAELARQFGADDYGMKQYVFVILKTGKAKIEDAALIEDEREADEEALIREGDADAEILDTLPDDDTNDDDADDELDEEEAEDAEDTDE